MTNSDALKILQKESKCGHRDCAGNIACGSCEYKIDYDILIDVIDAAIEALELMICLEDDKK